MIEVFRTNVVSDERASQLIGIIEKTFEGYKVNFDLQDCDHVMRIAALGMIDNDPVLHVLKNAGVKAEVLPDVVEDFALMIT